MDKGNISKCWYESACQLSARIGDKSSPCKYRAGCIRYNEMLYLMQNSGIPFNRQMPVSLDPGRYDYDAFCDLADIKDGMLQFVKNGENLYITSEETGNGKTSWAIKLMLKYFDNVWCGNGFRVRGLFVHVPTILTQLKNFDNPLPTEYKQNLYDADLVIWDDIASTGLSNYDHTQLLTYIDRRYLESKANIYTGNLPTKELLEKMLGQKLASRVWNTSTIIKLKGKDRR